MDHHTYRDCLQARVTEPSLAFEPTEYDHRLTAVRRAMADAGFDALLLTEPGDLCYLTGYRTFEVSVQCALIVSQTGTMLFVPAIETGPAVYLSRVKK